MTRFRTNTIGLGLMVFLATFTSISAQIKPLDLVQDVKNSHLSFKAFSFFQENNNAEHQASNLPQLLLGKATVLQIKEQEIFTVEQDQPKAMSFSLPFAQNVMDLELVQIDFFPNGLDVVEMPTGKSVGLAQTGVHYRGIIKGDAASVVSVSVINGQVFGLISAPSVGNLVLGKMKNDASYVLYKDEDIASQFSYTCETDTRETAVEAQHIQQAENGETQCAGVWLDVGNDIVLGKGGVEEASAYIAALFAQVAVLYAIEDINLYLSGLRVWSEQEPFSNLNEYADFRKENAWTGSLAHYVNYAHGGGIAWTNALCDHDFGYGASGITPNFGQAPTYSWSVYVIAHELGHGFGSPHTHDCAWNGNNTPIDGCGPSACTGDVPQNGGTIMSYCYMNTVGVNFSLGFGQQPGDLIRTRLSEAGCTTSCDDQNGLILSAGLGLELPEGEVLAFPNPATDVLNVRLSTFGNSSVKTELVSLAGVVLRNTIFQKNSISATQQIQVCDLPRGIYFLKIQNENGQQRVQKIVLR